MIRHIVLINFAQPVNEDAIAGLWRDLDAIRAQITGVISITAGRSESPEQMDKDALLIKRTWEEICGRGR